MARVVGIDADAKMMYVASHSELLIRKVVLVKS